MRIFKGLLVAMLGVFLAACGGSSSSSPAGSLSVWSSSLTFTANGIADATPAPQRVTGSVTGVTSGTLYVNIVGTGTAIASISQPVISGTTGQSWVSVPPPSTLGIGSYTGTIKVSACQTDPQCTSGNLSSSPQTVNVTYNVAGLKSSAPSLSYTILNSPLPADLTGQFTVSAYPAQNWTASAKSPWLAVTTNGVSGGTITANLVQSALDNLDDGVYTDSIHIVPATSGQPLDVPISLTVRRTQVDYVSPYVAYQGTGGTAIIRGQEFSQLTGTSAIQNVLFGTTVAPSFTVVSNTEIHAAYPATLPMGTYPVVVQSNFTGIHQLAKLVVTHAPSFAATSLAYPDAQSKQVSTLVYDAERAALGVSVWYPYTGATAMIRIGSSANGWQAPVAKSITNHFGLALAADGAAWVAGAYRDVQNLDPVDLTTLTAAASPISPGSSEFIEGMAVSSDGTVAVIPYSYPCSNKLMLYNVRKQTFAPSLSVACRSRVGASGDGSRVLVVTQYAGGGTDDVYSLDTATGTLTATGLHILSAFAPVLDRAGDRLALSNINRQTFTSTWQIYDGAYLLLGSLPSTTNAVILRPDGSRAYAFDQSGLLRTYDLTAAVGGLLPEIGTGITLAARPSTSGTQVQMAITPDGKTVFVAGDHAVVVQPVP